MSYWEPPSNTSTALGAELDIIEIQSTVPQGEIQVDQQQRDKQVKVHHVNINIRKYKNKRKERKIIR